MPWPSTCPSATVTVGEADDLRSDGLRIEQVVWSGEPAVGAASVQCSAHGTPRAAQVQPAAGDGTVTVRWDRPERRVAPGQSVVLYDGDVVLGGGLVALGT